jgi:hypothetical protein
MAEKSARHCHKEKIDMPIELGKKVSELSGAELDYWVAKANGCGTGEVWLEDNKCRLRVMRSSIVYSPSTDWSQGGPIIQKYGISLDHKGDGKYDAKFLAGKPMTGMNALQATCRLVVALRFGEEVPDET